MKAVIHLFPEIGWDETKFARLPGELPMHYILIDISQINIGEISLTGGDFSRILPKKPDLIRWLQRIGIKSPRGKYDNQRYNPCSYS